MIFSKPQIKYQIHYELVIYSLTTEREIFLPLLLIASTNILASATHLMTINRQLALESFVTEANC